MTKEEVLGIAGLTAEEKARVEAAFLASERTKGICKFTTLNTEAEVKTAIAKLVDNYAKRCAAKAKKAENKKTEEVEVKAILEAVAEAKKFDYSVNDIINAINALVKEKKNAKTNADIADLQAKIAELQAQIIK